MTYAVRLTRSAKNALADMPMGAAEAAVAFIFGPLAAHPRRVGAELRAPFAGQHAARVGRAYRVRYTIDDDEVIVVAITGRAHAYRT